MECCLADIRKILSFSEDISEGMPFFFENDDPAVAVRLMLPALLTPAVPVTGLS